MKIFLILSAIFMLSACVEVRYGGHFIFEPEEEEVKAEPLNTHYSVFFESEPMPLAMFEPQQGAFLGIYSDVLPGIDGRVIAGLESLLGVQHAAFVEVIELGLDEYFPALWLLECIAEHKIPVIVIVPPTSPEGSWEEMLLSSVSGFSEYPVPMFVVFYPLSADTGWQADTYIAFFRYARAIFAEHAPHVAFVWAADADKDNFLDFFPGNSAVDWVGLSLNLSGSSPCAELLERALGFYHHFHRDFPIMLNLGISHFSTEDHRYHISETATLIRQIYSTILKEFPQIKMVNYMDLSRLSCAGSDYRIRMDAALRKAYRESTQDFISRASLNSDFAFGTRSIRSAYAAYVEDGVVYVDTRTLTNELGMPLPAGGRWIGGAHRVDVSTLPAGRLLLR